MSAVTLPALSPIVQIPNGEPGVTYREVVGFPAYAVGDDGNIWSRWKQGGRHCGYYLAGEWRKMLVSKDHKGYRRILLCAPGHRRVAKMGVLVLEAFVGLRQSGMELCHGPRGNVDDRLDNVRWDTRRANDLDKIRAGTSPRGTRNIHNKLSEGQVREIRLLAETMTATAIGKRFGVDRSTIPAILRRKNWWWLK